jgi:hypothetical protein
MVEAETIVIASSKIRDPAEPSRQELLDVVIAKPSPLFDESPRQGREPDELRGVLRLGAPWRRGRHFSPQTIDRSNRLRPGEPLNALLLSSQDRRISDLGNSSKFGHFS